LPLCRDARGGDGGVREKLAEGITMNHYRIALALTSALVLLEVGFFLYLGGFARFPRGAVTLSSIPVVVLLGLWLQSYIFRYCGGVLFFVLGSWFVWSAYYALGQKSALLIDSYFFILGALYLFDGAILLFSKPFAVEFERLRTAQSKHKARLRKVFVIAAGVAILIALWQDVVHLVNLWNES
jgi:hypothetical protein